MSSLYRVEAYCHKKLQTKIISLATASVRASLTELDHHSDIDQIAVPLHRQGGLINPKRYISGKKLFDSVMAEFTQERTVDVQASEQASKVMIRHGYGNPPQETWLREPRIVLRHPMADVVKLRPNLDLPTIADSEGELKAA